MATDWITHLSLPHGNIHLGVQVATNNSIGHKVQILLKRPVHDRDHTSESPLVRQFLRHNTAILAFPFFHPQADILEQGRKDLLSGNIDYQFHSLREHCPDFESYSRWIMELFEGLHRGIVERSIVHNRYCQNLSYDFPAKHGGTFVVECDTKEKRPFVTIQFFRDILRKNKNKIVALIMPIDPDFLDIYRDMAGVRAE